MNSVRQTDEHTDRQTTLSCQQPITYGAQYDRLNTSNEKLVVHENCYNDKRRPEKPRFFGISFLKRFFKVFKS